MPKKGTLFLHYKGKLYKYLATATHSETGEELVIYQALYGEFGLWARPKQMFFEKVLVAGKLVPRFQELPPQRCPWAENHPLLQKYHDEEWGVPCHEDRAIFELLCLEGAQAGLSWLTVLKKRPAYRQAFHNFEPAACAALSDADLEQILQEAEIVKNRRKVYGVRTNARAALQLQKQFGSLAAFFWAYTQGQQVVNHWLPAAELPAQSPLSQQVSRDLKKQGFVFVGPVIIYSFLQAIGIISDHLVSCCFARE